MIRFADQPFLHERHLLKGKLDPEIPARDHHRVRRRHDALQVIERRRLLDLGDELDRVGHEPPQLLDVLRAPHEREGQIIDSGAHRLLDVLPILLRQRGRGYVQAREVHALMCGQNSTVDDTAAHARFLDAGHLHRQKPVIQENPRPHSGIGGEAGVRGWQLVTARDFFRGEHHLLSGRQLTRIGKVTDANARSLKIEQHRERHVNRSSRPPRSGDPFPPQLGSAVRCIDPHDVGARLKQGTDRGRVRGGGPEGRDDFRTTDQRVAVQPVFHKFTRLLRCGKLARSKRTAGLR